MNMFRDLTMLFLIGVGLALTFSNPLEWSFLSRAPAQLIEGITFAISIKPFSSIVCFALALGLFMTRLKY